jgi:hypothetical protein
MKVLLPTLGLGGPSHGAGGRSYADQIAGARRFTGSRCGRSMISRPPRPLVDGETVDLGGKEVRTRRVRHLATPHVPHNWGSQVLFRGDHRHAAVRRSLLTDRQSASRHLQQPRRRGDRGRAHLPRDLARAGVPATLRRLAELQPGTLAIMHAGRTAATAALPCGLLLTPTRRSPRSPEWPHRLGSRCAGDRAGRPARRQQDQGT